MGNIDSPASVRNANWAGMPGDVKSIGVIVILQSFNTVGHGS